jgi:hypothetical protein
MVSRTLRILVLILTAIGSNADVARTQPAADVPPGVFDANLGDVGTSFSIRLIEVPYYYGERLVVEATVRNVGTKRTRLPLPDAIPVIAALVDQPLRDQNGKPSTFEKEAPRIDHHHGGHMSFGTREQSKAYKLAECLEWMNKNSVDLEPGESRTGYCVQEEIGLDKRGKGTLDYVILFLSHGVLPSRWFRFPVHRVQEPVRAKLVYTPGRDEAYWTYRWVAPAWPGTYVVQGWGAFEDPAKAPPMTLDTLNRITPIRYALISKPDPSLEFDDQGRLLVDGQVRESPDYCHIAESMLGWGWSLPVSSDVRCGPHQSKPRAELEKR